MRVLDQEWKKESLRKAKQESICRWCGGSVKRFDTRRRTFCSQSCVDEFLIRSDPGYARKLVYKRDRGVCQQCGLNCSQWFSEFKRWLRSLPLRGNEEGRSIREWAVRFYMEDSGLTYVPDWKHRSTFYDVDHRIEASTYEGCCGLDNLQTLCCSCHRAKTITFNRTRVRKNKE